MNVPDPLFYASIPTLGGLLLWGGRQFVLSTIGMKGDKGEKGDRGESSLGDSVRDFVDLRKAITEELNGRYMFADEARQRFEKLECGLENLETKLIEIHNLLAA